MNRWRRGEEMHGHIRRQREQTAVHPRGVPNAGTNGTTTMPLAASTRSTLTGWPSLLAVLTFVGLSAWLGHC
jgi:hypothetical protein